MEVVLIDGGGVGLAKDVSGWLEVHQKFGKDSKGCKREEGGKCQNFWL